MVFIKKAWSTGPVTPTPIFPAFSTLGDNPYVLTGSPRTISDWGGTDSLMYWGSENVTINLNEGAGSWISGQAATTIAYGTVIENAAGGEGNDWLVGNQYANMLVGNGGRDIIFGGGGNDTIRGDDGNDQLFGGEGDDTIRGGVGDDTLDPGDGRFNVLDGGEGRDTASFASLSQSMTIDLNGGTASSNDWFQTNQSTLISIENVVGTNFSDSIFGNDEDNNISGGGGNDILAGGNGINVIDGGDGVDTVSYLWQTQIELDFPGRLGSPTGAVIDLEAGSGLSGSTYPRDQVFGSIDTLINIENAIGTRSNDIIRGNSSNNVLQGDSGEDTLSGGRGNNTLDGGKDTDTADYGWVNQEYHSRWGDNPFTGVNVDLQEGRAFGAGFVDRLVSIENVTGSDLNDLVSGNSENNVLSGGAGDDVFRGNSGQDTIDGAEGTDTVAYDWSETGVYVSLSGGFAITGQEAKETLSSIENVIGSAFDDMFESNGADNVFTGGMGNDGFRFFDGWGHDTITDFDPQHDGLDFNIAGLSSVDQLEIVAVEGGTEIRYGDNVLKLDGVSPEQLTADNFSFEDPAPAPAEAAAEPQDVGLLPFDPALFPALPEDGGVGPDMMWDPLRDVIEEGTVPLADGPAIEPDMVLDLAITDPVNHFAWPA